MRCTAVMLDWDRPDNVTKIAKAWSASSFIDRGFIFSNKPRLPVSTSSITAGICASEDLGLSTRFLPALLAENNTILIQDDDLLLPEATLAGLLAAHKEDPGVIHGIFGRRPKQDTTYAKIVDKTEASVEVVLTRALVCTKQHCLDFFKHKDNFPVLRAGTPKDNGEDIVFSFIAMLGSGRLNKVHALSVTELDARSAIGSRPGHWAHRTEVLQCCTSWLHSKRSAGHG